ncbi:MAG TPA: DoxX family protein [Chloroflexia bacterium]|nr:DoxX family protein [Chloroflexia bacterium]
MHWLGAGSLFPGWSKPIRGTPAQLVTPLRWLALIPRLYAGIIFIPYGFDKVLNNNQTYAMDAAFFRAAGVPFPEVAQVLIGALELFGGVMLIGGFLTRAWAFLLAVDMLVAIILVGNTSVEVPLFLVCLLLIPLGGGMLSGDLLLDY